MPVSLGATGQPGFDQPIDLMMDCHRRIEHFLNVLRKVATTDGELDGEHRTALTTALRYFQSAAPRHTEDEEDSLFPRIRAIVDAASGERSPEVATLARALRRLEELEADHRVGSALHERIDAIGWSWLDTGRLSGTELQELRSLVSQLEALYRCHIAIEDDEVFPAAAAALRAVELNAIGREMADRRADNPGRPESRCGQRRRAAARRFESPVSRPDA